MLVSFSVVLRATFLRPSSLLSIWSVVISHQSSYIIHHYIVIINPLVILHVIVAACLHHEVKILSVDREGFLYYLPLHC